MMGLACEPARPRDYRRKADEAVRINRVVAAFVILVLLVGASLGLISGAVQALGRDALYAGGWLGKRVV